MPHVEIKCYPGRTDEQKLECADRVARAVSETLGCDISHVSVAVKEVEKADWKEQVWDKMIVPDEKYLYKKPGYKC
ncbi:MAG: tautomerase family protein [Oscillospiraceae bacterium]|nr:tautomerase family protein [Oscillospiraceae bacterium]